MARNALSSMVDLALLPVRLAGRTAAALAREVGGRSEPVPPAPPAPPPPPVPKPLDDVTIARKVETVIFRDRRIAKGKVDVNVAEGVVWLRGEVKTPALIRRAEQQVRDIPEVRGVENLLRLPKTPAPSRTDTPVPMRKTRRSRPDPAARKVTPGRVSDKAPDPPVAEPSPKKVAARRGGRKPAPLGGKGEGEDRG